MFWGNNYALLSYPRHTKKYFLFVCLLLNMFLRNIFEIRCLFKTVETKRMIWKDFHCFFLTPFCLFPLLTIVSHVSPANMGRLFYWKKTTTVKKLFRQAVSSLLLSTFQVMVCFLSPFPEFCCLEQQQILWDASYNMLYIVSAHLQLGSSRVWTPGLDEVTNWTMLHLSRNR